MRNRLFIGVFFGATILIIALLVYFSIDGLDTHTVFLSRPPNRLDGYDLLDYRVGEGAIGDLGSVHSFLPSESSLVDALIAVYVRGSDIIHIWVAVFKSADDAARLTEMMFIRMNEGGSPYTPPEAFDVDGVKIYFGSGSAMNYYFFNYENSVVWISTTDPETVETLVIKELLDYLASHT